jgi:hypothetical protein
MKTKKQETTMLDICNNVELARIDLGVVAEAIEKYVDNPKNYRIPYMRDCLNQILSIETHLDEITFRMRNAK